MDAGFERIELTTTDAVGSLRLARPDRGNALDHRTLEELIAAATLVRRSFQCARRHHREFGTIVLQRLRSRRSGPVSGDGGLAASVDLGRLAMNAITSMRAVTVARVHGRASGGGVVLALACDLCVAAKDAEFSLPESHLGIPIPWATLPQPVRQIDPAEPKNSFSAPVRSAGPMLPPTDSSRQRCPSRSSTPRWTRWSKSFRARHAWFRVRVGRDRSPRRMHRPDQAAAHRHRQHDARLCG